MTPTASAAAASAAWTEPSIPLDLDALADMDTVELGQLYARGTVPTSLAVLNGRPRGRMLAVRSLDRGRAGAFVRRLAAWSAFPWGGKSFTANDLGEGRGINRVRLGGRHNLFPFHTRFADSRLDGARCIELDYDLGDNPAVIRKIHDEIREVAPGLFLGPAMWKTAGDPAFVLWFALDTNIQAAPIGE